MTRLLWVTDPHLDHLGPGGAKEFGRIVNESYVGDLVVVTGDLAVASNFESLIEDFAIGVDKPVWFVLGNHDYWKGSIANARSRAARMKGKARWLTTQQVQLNDTSVLIGNDGWYDARLGDPKHSNVLMNDFHYTKELRGLHTDKLFAKCREIADTMAAEAEVSLADAVKTGYKRIFFATHIPPFSGATWHEGAISDKHWLPWMASRVMGDTLDKVARENPDVELVVLCGHTHSAGKYQHRPNLTVFTGHSEYRYPRVCGQFDFV